MTTANEELLIALELHSVERIRTLLDAGLDVQALVRGKTPVNWLTEMYTRSDRFPGCLALLLERGAVLDDPAVAPVLLDDADALATAIRSNPSLLEHRTTMASAFTPLVGASLLHVAAEYGHVKVARVLLEMGADVDARAAVDAFGLNGHTALFHTVNSNGMEGLLPSPTPPGAARIARANRRGRISGSSGGGSCVPRGRFSTLAPLHSTRVIG